MWSKSPITHNSKPALTEGLVAVLLAIASVMGVVCAGCDVASAQPPAPLAPVERALPPPIPLTVAPQETASLLIHNALRQAVWGPAVTCKIRQRISLLDKQLVGVGKYAHAGRGSGKLKMHVRLVAGDQINTLVQVSDGTLVNSSQHIGDFAQRSRIDLNRIREYLGPITTASLEDPVIAMYLAVGGQAELLRKLAQQYRWTHVQSGKLGELDVWWLSGELASEPPTIRAYAQIDQLLYAPNDSGLLPTKARIALGRGEPFPLWLYQIEQAREDSLMGIKSQTRLSMLLEFTEPAIVEQLPDELFQSQSSNETIVEETQRYLPPAPAIARTPVAQPLR